MGERRVLGTRSQGTATGAESVSDFRRVVFFELYDVSTVKVDVGRVCSSGVVGGNAKVRGF
jgi:hypothetical protein